MGSALAGAYRSLTVAAAKRRRGGALVSVLWLTAALVAIAFSVATLVRGEVERATNLSEGTRAYFVARGGLERFLFELEDSPLAFGGGTRSTQQVSALVERQGRHLVYPLPEGEVHLELIAEAGKLDINKAGAEQIERVLVALGLEPDRIQRLTAAILDWRGGMPGADPLAPGPFDAVYLARRPSFRPPRASFQQIEELLLVEGMTPELFYGGYHRAADGTLVPHAGLRDCFTTVAAAGPAPGTDILSASLPVLIAGGMPPALAGEFVRLRQAPGVLAPEAVQQALQSIAMTGAAPIPFAVGGRTVYTVTSTARLGDTRRAVSALVRFLPKPNVLYQILRWDDQAVATSLWTEARR